MISAAQKRDIKEKLRKKIEAQHEVVLKPRELSKKEQIKLKIKNKALKAKVVHGASPKYSAAQASKPSIVKIIRFIIAYAEMLGRASVPNFENFHPYEVEFAARSIQSLINNDGEEITALFSRQSGKSLTISLICSALLVVLPKLARIFPNDSRLSRFRKGIWIGIFAPIQDQSYIAYDKIRAALGAEESQKLLSELNIGFETNRGDTIQLTNGSKVVSRSASPGSHIEGKTYHLIIIDECQEVGLYKIRKSIHPMGAATNATLIKIGTPNTMKGDFYFAIDRNKKIYANTGKKNHFEFDYKVASQYNPLYAKYIQEEKWRLGEDSDEFRMSYKLQWILERGMFLTEDQLEAVKDKQQTLQDTNKLTRQVCGVDFGKSSDSTVVTVVEVEYDHPIEVMETENIYTTYSYITYNKKVIHLTEFQGDDYETQFHAIMDIVSRFNIERMFIDSTGVGDPMADRLMAYLPHIDVVPYHFTTASKSEGYKFLAQEIQAGRLKVPAHKDLEKKQTFRKFCQQMLDLEKTYSGQYMVCCHPDVNDAHDDYCDSLMLACMASKEEGFSEISVAENPFFS